MARIWSTVKFTYENLGGGGVRKAGKQEGEGGEQQGRQTGVRTKEPSRESGTQEALRLISRQSNGN